MKVEVKTALLYNDSMNSNIARIIFRITFILLGLDLAVLAISPIAAPVSDGYLATFGWIAIVLIAASAISWILGRK